MSDSTPATEAEVEAIVDAAIAELETTANDIMAEGELLADDDMQQMVQNASFTSSAENVPSFLCALAICQDIAEKRLQYASGVRGVVVVTAAAVVAVVGAGGVAIATGATVGIVTASVGLATFAGFTGQWLAGESLFERARALRRCLRGEEVGRFPTRSRSQRLLQQFALASPITYLEGAT